jgi:hypothetical protein
MNGLPDLRLLPDAAVPDGRTVLPTRTPTSVEAAPGSRAASTAFHTGYQRDRGLESPTQKGDQDQGPLPNDDAARNLIYLAVANAGPAWTRTRNWTAALLEFKIHFGDRLAD